MTGDVQRDRDVAVDAVALSDRKKRILSLDQYRGYAIFGMILVNYLGNFDAMPEQFRHHRDWFSYADTIAPIFMFVVGMGFRMSFGRRAAKIGLWPARWAAAKRYATLTLVGVVIYGGEWQWIWDALVDIGIAGLLAIPFIERGAGIRVGAATFYLILFQLLYTFAGYGAWTMPNSIDGGPLGPLSWAFILLLGTLAYDLLATGDRRKIVVQSLAWGIGLFALGWVFKVEWPGIKEMWPFSQRGMTMPYPIAATGLCFLHFLFFYYVCDVFGFEFPGLGIIGMNALTIYCVQQAMLDIGGTYISDESGVLMALVGFTGFYLFCYGVAWRLYKDKIVIRL